MVWVPQTLTLPFKLGDIGSNFGGSFDGGWKTFQGSSIHENTGKIRQEMGEKLGAQNWGFKLPITSMLSSTRKTLDADNEKMPFQTRAFSFYSSSQWVSQWDLSALQAPKPLGLESQVLHEQVALGDGYQVKPKWRRCGQN